MSAPIAIVEPIERNMLEVSWDATEPCAASAIIPAMISPPLTNKSAETVGEYSLRAITNAIIDIMTALPPKTPPLMASSKGKKPCLCGDKDATATSDP